MPQLLPGRAKNSAAAGRGAAGTGSSRPPTGALDTVDDFDGRLELTGPLSIVAPRRIGQSELVVSPLALSGSAFGSAADDATSLRILDRYSALGGNFLDTADTDAGGRSEELIGDWMRARHNRDAIVLATKIGRHGEATGLGQVSIVRAVEASLARLKTDHIDLLYFHGEDPVVPLEDSLATVEWLMDSGKVRHLGATDFSAERLIEARVLSATGLPKFVGIQSRYNLVQRDEFESSVRIVAAGQGLSVMPTGALAGGYLTGTYRSRADLAASWRGREPAPRIGRRGNRRLAALERVAAEHDTSMPSIAVAWLLAKRGVAAPVATASAPQQVDALMLAAGIRLTRAQMLELDRA